MKMSNYYLTRAEIMTRAQALTTQAMTRWPDQDRRATLTVCLRIAWADARQPQTLEQFRGLDGKAQLDLLRKFAARCPSYAARQTRKDPETGERVPAPASWAQWMTPRASGGLELEPWDVAVDTVAAEAWIGLDRQPEDLPLGIILARAARAACVRLSKVYRDAPNNRKRSSTQDGTGTILDAVSLDDPDYSGAARYPSPEAAVIVRESIRTAARDNKDLAILDLRAQEYTLQETGKAIGMSHPAVIKRINGMRTRLDMDNTRAAADALDAAVMTAAGVKAPRPRHWTPDNASSSAGTGTPDAPKHGTVSRPAGPVNGNLDRAAAEVAARSAAAQAAAEAKAAREAEQAAAWEKDMEITRSRAARFAEGRRDK